MIKIHQISNGWLVKIGKGEWIFKATSAEVKTFLQAAGRNYF